MKPQREIRLPKIGDELDDDTDEIELSPEQLLTLSRAVDTDDLGSPTAEVNLITATAYLPAEHSSSGGSPSNDRWSRFRVAGFLGIASAVIAVGGLWRCTAARNPPAAVVAVGPVLHGVAAARVPTPAPAPAAGPPVRIKNPFDKTEVFEFPAGTSVADARASVANTLRQRALERQSLQRSAHHGSPGLKRQTANISADANATQTK